MDNHTKKRITTLIHLHLHYTRTKKEKEKRTSQHWILIHLHTHTQWHRHTVTHTEPVSLSHTHTHTNTTSLSVPQTHTHAHTLVYNYTRTQSDTLIHLHTHTRERERKREREMTTWERERERGRRVTCSIGLRETNRRLERSSERLREIATRESGDWRDREMRPEGDEQKLREFLIWGFLVCLETNRRWGLVRPNLILFWFGGFLDYLFKMLFPLPKFFSFPMNIYLMFLQW